MHSLDHQVLFTLQQWVEQELTSWLCTIVATHGSSPRPVGSVMACNRKGQVTGSLSGGCVEEDLIQRLLNSDITDFPSIVEYGVSAEENARLGLPCGGKLTVMIEKLDRSALPILQSINQTLNNRECIERTTELESGTISLRPAQRFAALEMSEKRCIQVYGPRYNLLLVGAGQIAECLAQMASMMDYRVIVTDPREDKLKEFQSHIKNESIDCECVGGMPDDVARQYANDPFSIVITLTHDPRIDDMALMEALTLQNYYVGALGSVRTTNQRLKRLAQLDLSPKQINRLHAPVGLSIGSKTAPEIAVSILAQLTQIRRTSESNTNEEPTS
ncbi:XdhC family protein [Ketobacter sp. MCCC 1A13808]|uniref:XdhC family protein n=1 Tax=Ketobacter sp. MCCC 1A13808 TaxID=2602738 RepID=UPI000F1DCC9B|nr:XdhC family protein [Ketobacter sp. MCCC 1A13808]MVF13488.1 XdhC family protein [Ketobacter sp. MCCC 1A13808]RLP52409.1 MAG: XdhC family protein [Ketobacter sp.]